MKSLSIGQLSNSTGVNIETIRYYEREGILPDPLRTESGRRVYESEDVKQLSFIRKCRNLGFSLKEIRNLLQLVDSGSYTCREINELANSHIIEIHRKIEELQQMEQALKELASECSQGMAPDCPIIDRLYTNEE